MYQWKNNYKWIFSDLGAADKVGVNESGIGIFKRQPYKGLAKEILQNVTDAKNPNLPIIQMEMMVKNSREFKMQLISTLCHQEKCLC